ncbi:MAG: hypothetical protein SH821_06990 [Phototrophicales bacterium]|nr:hypothetical protein [Phototrophicales bacterium]
MEFLRGLSFMQMIALFATVFVIIIIAVVLTTNANQEVVVNFRETTPTPFIDHSIPAIVIPFDTNPTLAP